MINSVKPLIISYKMKENFTKIIFDNLKQIHKNRV